MFPLGKGYHSPFAQDNQALWSTYFVSSLLNALKLNSAAHVLPFEKDAVVVNLVGVSSD